MAAKTQDAAGREKYLRAELTPIVADAFRRARRYTVEKRVEMPDPEPFVSAIVRLVSRETAIAAPRELTDGDVMRMRTELWERNPRFGAERHAWTDNDVAEAIRWGYAAARVPAPSAPQEGPVEGSAVAKLRELADMVNGPLAPALGDVVLDNRVAEMYVGIANEILNAVETLASPRELTIAAPTGETSDFETAVAFTIERVNAWLAGKPRNRPAAIEAFARFLVRDLYSYCDLAARVPAPSVPQEPRGGVEPSEGMVERAAMALVSERYPVTWWEQKGKVAEGLRTAYRQSARLALTAALSSEARDAD